MRKLLIVDDSPIVLELLEIAMSGEYEVKTAAEGSSALALARQWKPDGVLTDHWMPGMTGLDLARALVQLPDPPGLILLSAGLTREVTEEAIHLGFAACVSKPFDLDELKALVRRVVIESQHPASS